MSFGLLLAIGAATTSTAQCRTVVPKHKTWKSADLTCDTSRTSGMIMFEKGFKADTVTVWMNDSLLYSARITTTPNTGSAGSLSYRFRKLTSPTVKLMINGTCYVVPMRSGACYLYISRRLGRLRLVASSQFQGFSW
jgi:hypothetical protein